MLEDYRPDNYDFIRRYVNERVALTIGTILPHLEPEDEVVVVLREGKFGWHAPDLIEDWRNAFDPIVPGCDAYLVEPVKHKEYKSKFKRPTRHLADESTRTRRHVEVDGRDLVVFRSPVTRDDFDEDEFDADDLFDDAQTRLGAFEPEDRRDHYPRRTRLPV